MLKCTSMCEILHFKTDEKKSEASAS